MGNRYFNYEAGLGSGWWGRRAFLHYWWRFYQRDHHWAPPPYHALRQALRAQTAHLARLAPRWLYLEALPRPRAPQRPLSAGGWVRPVAATALLHDRRRRDGAHYLGLLRCVNDAETLTRLLEEAAEAGGARSIVGPTHLSPYLGVGALTSHWNELPPQHTPYNPPYLPELLESVMEVERSARLFQLSSPETGAAERKSGPATLHPLQEQRLAGDLLPLLRVACEPWQPLPPPDEAEAAFLLRWLGRWPLHGLLALIDGEPAGFLLLQPDLAPLLRRAGGGRNLAWHLWLQWAVGRPAQHGRLLFCAVLPRWRRQGIGSQLWARALAYGREQGWQTMSVGPLPEEAPAGAFLQQLGAEPRQHYRLYRWQARGASFFF